MNPFTDSDTSWIEWWWDLDRSDAVDQSTNYEVISGEEERRLNSELLPGVTVKRRIMRARRRRVMREQQEVSLSDKFINCPSIKPNENSDLNLNLNLNKEYSVGTVHPSDSVRATKRRIQRVITNIDYISSLTALRQEESPRNMFDVTVVAPKGLGLNLSLLPDGSLVVRTFNPLSDNCAGPVERCGVVKIGDYLLGINKLSLIGLGLEQIAEILQNLDKIGEVSTLLVF